LIGTIPLFKLLYLFIKPEKFNENKEKFLFFGIYIFLERFVKAISMLVEFLADVSAKGI